MYLLYIYPVLYAVCEFQVPSYFLLPFRLFACLVAEASGVTHRIATFYRYIWGPVRELCPPRAEDDGDGSAPHAARFRDEHRDESARIDAEAELEHVRTENEQLWRLYEQALDDLRGERAREAEAREETAEMERRIQELTAGRTDDRATIERLQAESEHYYRLESESAETLAEVEARRTRLQEEAELQRLRAVEAERLKWEARETRLVRQLEEATLRNAVPRATAEHSHGRESATVRPNPGTLTSPRPVGEPESDVNAERQGTRERDSPLFGVSLPALGLGEVHSEPHPLQMPPVTPSASLLAQQLPPLTAFAGETPMGRWRSLMIGWRGLGW